MKKAIVLSTFLFFYFTTNAQRKINDNCSLLNIVFSDISIGNYFNINSFDSIHINTDKNQFSSCDSFEINGVKFRIIDKNDKNRYEGKWLTLTTVIRPKNSLTIYLDDESREISYLLVVRKVKTKYIITNRDFGRIE